MTGTLSPTRPSNRSGMGAIPYNMDTPNAGVTFRVWAPFADSASVEIFQDNAPNQLFPLASHGNGYWSTDVDGIHEGQKYDYVIRRQGQELHKTDPYARNVDHSNGPAIIVNPNYDWSNDNFKMPAWNELVIYQMHVGTFNDDPGSPPGAFKSVRDKLNDLRDLGINAIKVMPTHEFPGDNSWGYNPSHPFALESALGKPSEFVDFVKDAHAHGIAVLMDVVYNHFGPDDLDLWRFDGWHKDDMGGIYFYNDWRSWTPWGDKNRPDYGRREVRQYIRDNVLMWLEDYHCDGLRLDATAFIRNAYGKDYEPQHDLADGKRLMQWINNEVNVRVPWKIIIAEDIRGSAWITKDTGAGGAGFDSQWAKDEFLRPIRSAVVAPRDADRNLYAVRDAIYQRYSSDAFERVIYTESHDEVSKTLDPEERPDYYRLPEEIWRGHADSWYARKRSTLAAALVFTSPGIPMIFQGQEFLSWGSWEDQVPLDWRHKQWFHGIWDLYQSLIRLRRNWNNNTRGLRGQYVNVHHLNDQGNNKMLAFHRWEHGGPGDDVIIVANFADRSYDSYNIGFPREGTWYVRFNSDWKGFSDDFRNHPGYDTTAWRVNWGDTDGMPFAGNIGIGPYSVLILSQ
ncbi:MAG: alpha-amylase family glycosyl hydrolase [Cyanobacteria bacterium P01_D01_bin.14]